jgi:hypothetical protein
MKIHQFTFCVAGPDDWDAEYSLSRLLKHSDLAYWTEDYVKIDHEHDWSYEYKEFRYCLVCEEQEDLG